MNKILLIIQREYLSRVKKKSFLVATFLVPIAIMLITSSVIYLAVTQGNDQKNVEVVDESGWFTGKLTTSKSIKYTFTGNFTEAKKTFLNKKFDYLLYIPGDANSIQLLGEKTPGIMSANSIENDLSRIAQARKLREANIDSSTLAKAQQEIHVTPHNLSGEVETDSNVVVAMAVGFISAFLIYFALLLYGSQVMRGVVEEKVSRIIEVIISSVRPFQLMIGKIVGVGLVGLTQFVLWITLTITLSSTVGGAIMSNKAKAISQVSQSANTQATGQVVDNGMMQMMHSVGTLPVLTIVSCFLFYFLFGYLLYSALFAAVGSAVDSETETQQFVVPLTLPLILTMAIAQSAIINNPDGPVAVWLSMIPFTAPIAMMMRIPFHVPWQQLACSMVLMVLGFLFTTWVAGRIYRVGILMYGKKASYKELIKWFRYKE